MRDATPALVVDSVTGVEVELPVAGPGARAFAFIIDWHIRAILAVAWYAVGTMIYNRDFGNLSPPLESEGMWLGLVALPAGAIFFLYHTALEIGMRGRTPGKRMVGVRLVTYTGATPAFGALLIRNVFRLADNFPIFYGLGLVMTMVTRKHIRLGDLAAGTLLVFDRSEAVLLQYVRNPSLDAPRAEIINELLARWETLDPAARRNLARRAVGAGAETGDQALRAQLQRLAEGQSA